MNSQMTRGVSQSLYKYLPHSWIDFTERGAERHNYIAFVKHWNGEQLDGINKQRLLRSVNQAISAFTGGDPSLAVGYGSGLTLENCSVLTPKHDSEERGIVATISPLTFYCPHCHKVYQFKDSETYKKYSHCLKDGYELKQLRQIYACKCGWASDQHPVYCRNCKSSKNIVWGGKLNDYNFRCSKCGASIPMVKKCDGCGARVTPIVALDPAQYFSQTLSLIDIIDERVEHFISETDYGAILTIACWCGEISKAELHQLISDGLNTDPEAYQKIYDEYFSTFIDCKLSEADAANAAKAMADKQCGSKYTDIINKFKGQLYSSPESIRRNAEMLLEYIFVKDLKENSSLEDAAAISQILNTSADPDCFKSIAKEKAISFAQVCGEIPFISCSYGFTRKHPGPDDGTVLNALKEEKNGHKNIYATRLKTEGVLFEFDRVRILKWLLKNNYIEEADAPALDDPSAVKLWFANNIHSDLVAPFNSLDPVQGPTYYVYNLIHTLSHLLIRSAAGMCGLDKNSISEYIFPGIPAVLIYCQNSQGFNLGALFNLFEAYFDKWIENAYASAQKCIFDPVCINRYKACTGCLYLNEVSCQHFNHDLDRSLVIGLIDRATNTRHWGFWEV